MALAVGGRLVPLRADFDARTQRLELPGQWLWFERWDDADRFYRSASSEDEAREVQAMCNADAVDRSAAELLGWFADNASDSASDSASVSSADSAPTNVVHVDVVKIDGFTIKASAVPIAGRTPRH